MFEWLLSNNDAEKRQKRGTTQKEAPLAAQDPHRSETRQGDLRKENPIRDGREQLGLTDKTPLDPELQKYLS